jgi:long-chain acyl-CoA synthetase
MIKYKGFAVAPAEVESILLEHPAVRDCGVIGRADMEAGEVPFAFVVLRDDFADCVRTREDILGFLTERLALFKVPREIRFVNAIPRNPSGKILRRELRSTC